MKELEQLRVEYTSTPLDVLNMSADPVEQFRNWMQEALQMEVPEPHAMVLSTVDTLGQPSSRIVLLRGLEEQGFIFYTNYTSRKAIELSDNPQGALLFFWQPVHRQVRIEGSLQQIDPAISDAYFAQRPRGSQIGAWASPQSAPIPNREALERNMQQFEERFAGDENVPRPSFWGGYILKPKSVEFWQGRENRLHDRILYQRVDGEWKWERLAP
ncbi:MAG: pyridoxamine 5'-phosphate oxidase [Saprospiraceae bacterium]|nr:pyridoxamine 5'-phosphate oxidase [Saprospiraceae bacterium]